MSASFPNSSAGEIPDSSWLEPLLRPKDDPILENRPPWFEPDGLLENRLPWFEPDGLLENRLPWFEPDGLLPNDDGELYGEDDLLPNDDDGELYGEGDLLPNDDDGELYEEDDLLPNDDDGELYGYEKEEAVKHNNKNKVAILTIHRPRKKSNLILFYYLIINKQLTIHF
ncbi:MAG: hypothetical protein LBG13_03380 [Holosporales bacterium]|nr:hypothetical protein [Holosporales bacterium]